MERSEAVWTRCDRANEGVEFGMGLEEILEGKDMLPGQKSDIGDHYTKTARPKLVTSERETLQSLQVSATVSYDSLDELPSKTNRGGHD